MNLAFTNHAAGGRIRLEQAEGETTPRGIELALACHQGGGSAPQPQSLGQQTAESLQAQVNAAPAQFAAQSQFAPQYLGLTNEELQNFLMGTPGGTNPQTVSTNTAGFRNMTTGAFVAGDTAPTWAPTVSTGSVSQGGGGRVLPGQTNPWVPFTQAGVTTQNVTTPATPGFLNLLSQATPSLSATTGAATTAQVANQIADVGSMGPGATQALEAANPANAQLLDAMNQDTLQQLRMGNQLTPAMANQIQQSARAAQAARGLGTGTGDAGLEAWYMGQAGNQMQQQRFAQGQTMAQTNAGVTAPFLNMLGATPLAIPLLGAATGTATGAAGSAGPTLFNPQNQFAQNAFDTQLNASTSAYNAQQNNAAATTGAGVGLAGSLALAGGIAL